VRVTDCDGVDAGDGLPVDVTDCDGVCVCVPVAAELGVPDWVTLGVSVDDWLRVLVTVCETDCVCDGVRDDDTDWVRLCVCVALWVCVSVGVRLHASFDARSEILA
jgi:hypothetical protein